MIMTIPGSIISDILNITYILIFIALLDIVTTIHILLNKHEEAASAVLWLMTVFFIPGFGILLYILFGINRVYTKGLKIKVANQVIMNQKKQDYDDTSEKSGTNAIATMRQYLKQQQKFIIEKSNISHFSTFNKILDSFMPQSVILKGNKTELLCDGTQAYPQMLDAISNAESSIHLESYIIMNDQIGKEIFAKLRQKASEGVEVKVLYDRFGSFHAFITMFFSTFVKNEKNFQIKSFSLKPPWAIQMRNHRKLLIIDGKTAFLGGVNISSDNDRRFTIKKRYTHDLHCKVIGPITAELQFSFLRDWYCISNESPDQILKKKYFPTLQEEGEHFIRLITSGPGQEMEASEKMFMAAAAAAQKHLWIISPYFVPGTDFCKSLSVAAAKGVDVRIILPAKSDHILTTFASRSKFKTLIANGVRIFERHGSFLHAKVLLIDKKTARIGSSNCDIRSF
jgi:cardiolipin synthase